MNKLYFLSTLILVAALGNHCTGRYVEDSAHLHVPDQIDFNFHVRPILSDRCFACHGPDENARESDLRLDLREHAYAPIDSLEGSFAIVPGNARKSLMMQRITSDDPAFVMPPPGSNLTLAPYEIEILRKWIEQGAPWKDHWAFTPPQKSDPPAVRDASIINEIDHFILQRLKEVDLKKSPEASKEKLIRRLSFDLRGLPPSLEEMEAFVKNDQEGAYEELVDTFLVQSTYGERMALAWMDLARYADSHGYQDDIERSMWPWREWVIEAFNRNMAYDDFVTWQLAGDLMPNASYKQKLATGFNRNHKITQEVGVIDEEYRVTYVLDRVNTFSTAFLGMTVECAQCHDHKYDPITQKEYYQLFSFFNQVPEKGRVDYGVEVSEPSLPLPKDKIDSLRAHIQGLVASHQEQVQDYAEEKWRLGAFVDTAVNHGEDMPGNLPGGLVNWLPLDYIEDTKLADLVQEKSALAVHSPIPVEGRFSGGLEFMGLNYLDLPAFDFNLNRPFSLTFWIRSIDGGIRGTIFSTLDRNVRSTFSVQVTSVKTIQINLRDGEGRDVSLRTKETIPANQWVQISLTHDGSKRSKGIKVYMNGDPLLTYVTSDDYLSTIKMSRDLYLGAKYPIHHPSDTTHLDEEKKNPSSLVAAQIDELMCFNHALKIEEINALTRFDPIAELSTQQAKSLSDQRRLFYHHIHQDRLYRAMIQRFREQKIIEGRTEAIILKPTMIMRDMDSLRMTYILDRGQYDARTDSVEHGTPLAIMAFDPKYPRNRLGLSQWLFAEDHPLTSRVAVNHFWQMIFGRGLVATPGDFGSQGALPSHPELLDWLAVEFSSSGWNVKELLKKMVMSATYRQTTVTDRKRQYKDPDNNFLSRGPQGRLSAEMVRDHVLAISGLLTTRLGGPSVKPYQPKGLWLEVASGNQSLRKYIQDHGSDLYRRSLYTFWKRTIPPPSMTIFDAPSREQCIVKRRATSTPMQALVLLNDPQFVEASRLVAHRMITEGGDQAEDRIEFAFRLATSRSPESEEVMILADLLQSERAAFTKDTATAESLLKVGESQLDPDLDITELAAYTVVASMILNLTESIMKG